MRAAALIAAVSGVAGCFGPSFPEGFSCAGDGLCPGGQFCDPSDNRCKFVNTGDGDDAATGDAGSTDDDAPGAGLCDDPDIAVCLTMDGDTSDHSSRAIPTIAIAIDHAAGVTGDAAVFGSGSEILVETYLPQTPGPETIEWWLRVQGDGPVLATPIFSATAEADTVSFGLDGLSISVEAPIGQWVHLAIVLGERTEIFVDGNRSTSLGLSHPITGDPDLVAGGRSGSFTGRIDNLRVWSRELDVAEVAAIAASGN